MAIIRRRYLGAILCGVGAAFLFSTGGAAIKMVELPALQVSAVRSGVAAVILLLWLRGRIRWSRPVLWVSLGYAATLVLFVAATKLTTAASAIFLQSAAPLFIAALAPRLLGERVKASELAMMVAAMAGLVLCLVGGAGPSPSAPDPALGNVFATLCSISWACTLLGLRWLEVRERGTGLSAVVAGNLAAFGVGLPALLAGPAGTADDWATMTYLGVFQIGGAYVLLTTAIRTLTALHAALLLLIEPVLNPVWAWAVFGERPAVATLAGGAVIITAAALQAAYSASRR